MKKLFFLFAVALCASFSSCDNDGPESQSNKPQLNIALSKSEAPTVVSTNNFGFRLFDLISSDVGEQNVFFSPLVSSLNLSLVANAAAGDTRAEILTALGVTEGQIVDLNSAMNKIVTALPDADNRTKLTLTSSVWLSDRCNPTSAFKNTCNNTYKAAIRTYPFNSPTIASEINKWCSDNTNGVIKQIVDQSEMIMSNFAIVNASVFSGEWYRKFNGETIDEDFHTASQGTYKVPMMHDKSDKIITTSEKLSRINYSFGNDSFSIAFLLPHEGVALNDAIQSLDADTWLMLSDYRNGVECDITLAVPKLNLTTEYDMLKYYPELGITSALSDNADFSELGITSESGIPTSLRLSRQKAQFKMDEKGAEAVVAQITIGGVTDPGPNWLEMKEFRLDRPFAFVIYEQSTGAIMFAGKVEKP